MASRKLFLCLVLILVAAISAVTLYGCAETTADDSVQIVSMTVLTSHDGPYILNEKGHIEDMDLSEITVRVVYSNGEEEIIAVNDTMFTPDDIKKFEVKGDHTVFINYGNSSVAHTISVRAHTQVNTFTATFMSKGGSIVDNQYTKVIVNFETPVRENYTFDGWYTDFECTGDRVIAPYTLTEDTVFYAKWIDNRRCTVTFYDEEEVIYNFEVVYGESINPDDQTSYPPPAAKEGKNFKGWELIEGETHEIKTDVKLRAIYEAEKCLIILHDKEQRTVDYGTEVEFDEIVPEKPGHQGRWVAYIDDSESYVELDDHSLSYNPDTKTITANKKKIVIKPEYRINTYEIIVYNGLLNQTPENIKSGNIVLEQVYNKNGGSFIKEYGSTFNLAQTGGINDVEPTMYHGYNVDWCFITHDTNGKEIWRRRDNRIWDDDLEQFVKDEEGESQNFALKDAYGNTLAQIQEGNITEIQGNITIKPKYTKRIYTVTLSRDNEPLPIVFEVPYHTDFALYNPFLEEYSNKYANWQEVKDSYLRYTVAEWLTPEMVGEEIWQTAKWDIAWYNSPSSTAPENKVEFEYNEQTKSYGYYTILENTILYARDIDNRTYDVIIRYGYNFYNNTYTKEVKYTNLKQNQPLELPSDLTLSINYDGVVYTYSNLYDFPYQGANTKNFGEPIINPDTRTKNVVYYAHYANLSRYEVKIFDKTQSEAYPDGSPLAVPDGSIYYNFYSGTIFNLDMLYKGSLSKIAQTHYEEKKFIEDFYNITQVKYNQYLLEYGGGNKAQAISNIESFISQKQSIISEYFALLNILRQYSYDDIIIDGYSSVEEYYNYFFTDAGYDMNTIYGEYIGGAYLYTSNAYDTYREEIYDLEKILELINNYEKNKQDAELFETRQSYKYSDSVTHLNTIYEEGVTDYYFAGWYYDSAYTQRADDIETNPDNAMEFSAKITKDLILYAKWVDKKKGSEGLIFERVAPNQVVVVDFLNEAQAGSRYTGQPYSRNLNDQGNMPKELGNRISVQIPSEHQFRLPDGSIEICSVIGIVAGAFDTNAIIITDFVLPNSIKFIEERVFKDCNLQAINYQTGDTNYLYVDADIVVYQAITFDSLNNVTLADGRRLTSYNQGVLLTYANKSIVNTVYNIPQSINGVSIVRVADYAFRSTAALQTVVVSNNVVEIGDYAFMGCNKLSQVTLPNSLQTIGANAFSDCALLADVNFEWSEEYPSPRLKTIKEDAFKNTAWFINQRGLVIVDSILLGVQVKHDGSDYERDQYGNILVNEFNENYIIGKENDEIIYTVYINAGTGAISRIVINKAITVITDYAFSGTSSMVSLDINASSLVSIDDYAFDGCTGLSVIYFRNANADIALGQNILARGGRSVTFAFPAGYITENNWLAGERWQELIDSIDMMEIQECEFSTLTYYQKASQSSPIVNIPSFVNVIADNVFSSGFENIADVILPNTLLKIGAWAFANMTSLRAIGIPQSVNEIGIGAFSNCNNLEQIYLSFVGQKLDGTGATHFGYIFGAVTYQDNVSYVPASLKKVFIRENTQDRLVDIANYAFYSLSNLTHIDISKAKIGSEGQNAYYGCNATIIR